MPYTFFTSIIALLFFLLSPLTHAAPKKKPDLRHHGRVPALLKKAFKRSEVRLSASQHENGNFKAGVSRVENGGSTLTTYTLNGDCQGDHECFLSRIPKTHENMPYKRLGDVFFGLEKPAENLYLRTCNSILANSSLDRKFLTQYLKRMGWVERNNNNVQTMKKLSAPVHHDYQLARSIYFDLGDQYRAAADNEVVVYLRLGDMLHWARLSKKFDLDLMEETFLRVQSQMKTYPDISKVTIVTSDYNSRALTEEDKEYRFKEFSTLLGKLSTLTESIGLHSSLDLDEDVYYMATAKHFVYTGENYSHFAAFLANINASERIVDFY